MALTKQQRKHQALLNMLLEDVTTVQVAFNDFGQPNAKLYTYKAPASWNVQAGDHLVVDAPSSGMTVVTVKSVDKAPQFDPDADFAYKWAVQKVDTTGYKARQEREQLFLEQLADVERLAVRTETLQKAQAALADKPEAAAAFDAAVKALNGQVA